MKHLHKDGPFEELYSTLRSRKNLKHFNFHIRNYYAIENKNSLVGKVALLTLLMSMVFSVHCDDAPNVFSTSRKNTFEIVLGNHTTINESVPLFSNVYIKCRMENTTWLKNDIVLEKEEGSMTMKLNNIDENEAANYSCFSKSYNSWGNLTLNIQPNSSGEKNFLNKKQIYVPSFTDSSFIDSDYLELNKNDMDLEDGSKDAFSADMQTIPLFSEEHAPFFKNSQKLVKLLSKPSGSFIQLPCPANGNPMPNISWTKDGQKIARTMGKVSYKKWSINMEDLIPEDSGVYTCKICNTHGCIEHSANLIINDRLRSRPILSEGFPQNQTAIENSTVYLECKVISDLEPHIVWVTYQKNIQKIEEIEKLVPNLSNNAFHNIASDHPIFRKLKVFKYFCT